MKNGLDDIGGSVSSVDTVAVMPVGTHFAGMIPYSHRLQHTKAAKERGIVETEPGVWVNTTTGATYTTDLIELNSQPGEEPCTRMAPSIRTLVLTIEKKFSSPICPGYTLFLYEHPNIKTWRCLSQTTN